MGIELISVHIPKTAGSSFWKNLQIAYGQDAVLHEDKDRILDPKSKFNIDPAGWQVELESNVKTMDPQIRVIHGHFKAIKYRKYFPSARWIVWLRHPIARLISHYFFWKNKSKTVSCHTIHEYMEDNQLSIIEFAQLPMMRNILARLYLKGVSLDSFDFIGIQEHFDEDLKTLIEVLGWPDMPPQKANKNIEHNYGQQRDKIISDRQLIQTLEDLNHDDMTVYTEALKLMNHN